MVKNNPGFHSVDVGGATVTVLNDGQFEGSVELVVGMDAAAAESALRETFRALPPRITVSCFLVELPDQRVIVDFGAGGLFGPGLGFARRRLAALDIDPASVGTVLVTHCHLDHVGGLIAPDGAPVFPNAELVLNGVEADYWLSDSNRDAAPASARGHFDAARRALSGYRMRHICDGDEVQPGIRACHLPGHTPGHTGYRIGSGPDSLLIWADIVHLPGIQFARPEAGVVFDVDAAAARATRQRIFAEAAESGELVAGIHHDFPVFGRVRRAGVAYAFEPVVWAPTSRGLAG